MTWCIKTWLHMSKHKKKIDSLSIMSNLQPNCCLKFDFQKVDQHAGGKWLIHDTKRRKDNQLQSLKLPCRISKLSSYSISQEICTRFLLCCALLWLYIDFPISIRLTSLALWQSNDCSSASKATQMNIDKYFMWIHYERLHNHNKAKHNKTVCIFLGIYCRCDIKGSRRMCFAHYWLATIYTMDRLILSVKI